ncbi:AraC family transcriptional regulator [Chitinolyticbacter meiyuanensis]|uniref:AraC family transcriptional regulator n=1 Tax=Chitinolyticbacter meiyuanensis TaxID=682798 RepID=UPI0011E605A6|nr:AraC family transcriptional regulator [Chitinolyticbacter meiyuanensis]
MKPDTLARYTERICKVLDYLYAHSDSEPDLYTLADVACLSPYHFHRVYRGLMGETLGDTLKDIRLRKAAGELARTRVPLTRIAERAGFGSLPAFSRAFQQRYGAPPGRYRAVRALPFPYAEEHDMYPIEITEEAGTPLIGLAHAGDYHRIDIAFNKLFLHAGSAGWLSGQQRCIGIFYDDPSQVPEEKLHSHATLGVPTTPAALAAPFEALAILPGRCAVLRYTGPYSDLPEAYAWLFGHWLPQSGEETRDFPVYEEYLNDPKTTPPAELVTLIHLPLA